MHPEGVPSDNAIQEMLCWQRHTMQMMYSRIGMVSHKNSIRTIFGAKHFKQKITKFSHKKFQQHSFEIGSYLE